MKRLVLIDAFNLIFRAFYSIPELTTGRRELVNAVYGFTSILLRVIKELKPDYLTVFFDSPGPTFRHKEYKEYKATRPLPPENLVKQIPRVLEVCGAFNIPIFMLAGYEADDLIATIVSQAENKSIESIIVSGDQDLLQLVSKKTKYYGLKRGLSELESLDPVQVQKEFGLHPNQIIDYKAMRGDVSDNIPGVPGIGEKTAKQLLNQYQTLEGIYQNLENLKPKEQKLLGENKDKAFLAKQLVALDKKAPIYLDLDQSRLHYYNPEKAKQLFLELGFKSLLNRLPPSRDENQMTLL